jgi:SAM-dependent methyltransferase
LEKIFPGQLVSFLEKNKFLSKNDKILDVGCGAGRLLFSLKENGFDKVLGIDPFLEDNIHYPNGLSILKKTIHELEDSGFHLIMLNDSFEHVSDPLETLESAENYWHRMVSCLSEYLPYLHLRGTTIKKIGLIRVPRNTFIFIRWKAYGIWPKNPTCD